MFAPPYSPNKRFSNSKISLANIKKPHTFQVKHCLRCYMKSADSKYFSKSLTKLDPFAVTSSHKTLTNFKALSSTLTQPNIKASQKKFEEFEPFSTFGQNEAKKFLLTMKENKTTSLSLEKFNKQLKSQHKISYKKVVFSSTQINPKTLVKKPGKKQFENKKIYKLYESLRGKYDKLKAEHDSKVQMLKRQQKQGCKVEQKLKEKKTLEVEKQASVAQNYQIRTQWLGKGKGIQKNSPDSQTSIQGQDSYVEQSNKKMNQKERIRIEQIQGEKEYYRQECLSLEKNLQSDYNMVMELKKQIQLLKEKNELNLHQVFSRNGQNQKLNNQTPIRNQEFSYNSQINSSLLQKGGSVNSGSNNFKLPTQSLSPSGYQVSYFPTEESIIQSTSIIFEEGKRQKENAFKKIQYSNFVEKQAGKDDKEQERPNEVREKKIQRKFIYEPIHGNVIADGSSLGSKNEFSSVEQNLSKLIVKNESNLILKNDSNISGTTRIQSSGVSLANSSKFIEKSDDQKYLKQLKLTGIISPTSFSNQTKWYKSEGLIRPPDNIQTKPQLYTVSVNRYHSYCKKNCELNQCKCLLEMMTISSSNNIYSTSSK